MKAKNTTEAPRTTPVQPKWPNSLVLGLYSLAIHVAKAPLRATVLFAGAGPALRGSRLGGIRKSGGRI
jgi:hypothetical protein